MAKQKKSTKQTAKQEQAAIALANATNDERLFDTRTAWIDAALGEKKSSVAEQIARQAHAEALNRRFAASLDVIVAHGLGVHWTDGLKAATKVRRNEDGFKLRGNARKVYLADADAYVLEQKATKAAAESRYKKQRYAGKAADSNFNRYMSQLRQTALDLHMATLPEVEVTPPTPAEMLEARFTRVLSSALRQAYKALAEVEQDDKAEKAYESLKKAAKLFLPADKIEKIES